jgi:hypothetical protein
MPACRELMYQNPLRFGSHEGSQRRVRRQHPVVPVAVRARHRHKHQRGDALYQLKGGDAVRPACHRSAVWGGSRAARHSTPQAQSLQRKRWARVKVQQPLPAGAIPRLYADPGIYSEVAGEFIDGVAHSRQEPGPLGPMPMHSICELPRPR